MKPIFGSVGIILNNNTAFLILQWILKTILDEYQTYLGLSWYCLKLVYEDFKASIKTMLKYKQNYVPNYWKVMKSKQKQKL